jgi:hypothetical protein
VTVAIAVTPAGVVSIFAIGISNLIEETAKIT